ncbi:MAG: PEP-CTERM sorting domain-containing protein [Phycisphaerae bacterium]
MRVLLGVLAVGLLALPAKATTYNDATGDLHDGTGGGADFTGFPHLDIASVDVTNDLSNITFAVTLVGDIQATNWGKYMVMIDSAPGGDAAGNGWARPISMSSGSEGWLGSWVDGGGAFQDWTYDGALWNMGAQSGLDSITQFTATMTTSLASLNLAVGDSILFDVYSSGGGGGDSAIDALSMATPSVIDWAGPFDTTAPLKYNITPEPASLALVGLGGLALIRRRR